MKKKIFLLSVLGLPFVGFLVGVLFGLMSIERQETPRPVIGNVQTFEAAYQRWKSEAERNGQQTKLVLSLGHFKGLSSEFSQAHGKVLLDLADGSLTVEVTGLPEARAFAIWLVQNRPGPSRSVKPEPGDRLIRAGALTRQGEKAVLATRLERETLAGFKLDLMVVTPNGRNPADEGLLFGAPNVFQKIYYSDKSAERLVFTAPGDAANDNGSVSQGLLAPFRSLIPALAHADAGGIPNLASLLVRGERLFFEEQFNGNGRTCGSCHPAENNFTVDPVFIATLPADDPL